MLSDSGLTVKKPATLNRASTLTGRILLSGLALSFVIAAAYLLHPGFIRSLNNKTTDVVMALSKTRHVSASIAIVDIDEKSLTRYGQWPWPRYRLSHLLQKINELGAASIALNLILAEPDRTSPKNWQFSIERELGYRIDTSKIPTGVLDHDRYLADTLATGPFVLGNQFLFKRAASPHPSCGLHPLNVVWINSPHAHPTRTRFFMADSVVCNQRLFADAVSYSGFLNATPDADGILRRMPLLIQFEGKLYPSLALATLMQTKRVTQIGIIRRGSGLLNLVVNNAIIPIDRQGNIRVNFSNSPGEFQRVSARDLLDGFVAPERLKDKIVLVGSSASGWGHTYQTPQKPVHTHVDIHAQLLDNLITGNTVIRAQVFLLWETLLGLLVAALVCLSIARMEIMGSAVVGGVTLVGVWLGMGMVFQANGFLFSPFLPTVLIIFNYTVLTILKTGENQHLAKARADDTLILLKSSEKNLNSIIKTVPDIIFRLDPAGRITFISPAISKYTDRPDQLLGQPIFDLVAPEDRQKAQYRLNEKRTGERATRALELRLLLPRKQEGEAEEIGYFSVSAEGIYRNDTPRSTEFIGTQGIMRDITDHKKLEDRLLHAQKMEAVGNLAAGIAHDLNNILTGLVTYPDLLLLELPHGDPLHKKIREIQRSGKKAAAIVQDLLTFSRRGVKISEVVNVNTIISEYLASPEYGETRNAHPDIAIETDLASDLMNIKGSPVHLSKALMNIVNNAAEAMPAGGRIRLSTFNKYLDAPLPVYEVIPEGEYACIGVADEGVGIAVEDLHKIFEPFFTKKSMKRSGSGLGMTVIWATIKDHGGYIDLQSKEGEGTQFVLYLPATREMADSDSHRMVLEDYLGTENILVVDDVPEQVEIASKMLTKLGYAVSSVASGEAAVQFVQKQEVDLLVLDMIMPGGIDGLETYKRIIAIRPDQRVIIASGFSASERVKTAQELGAGAYIHKPYTLETIGIAVRKELDRARKKG